MHQVHYYLIYYLMFNSNNQYTCIRCNSDGQLGLGAGELGWAVRCRSVVWNTSMYVTVGNSM